MLSTSLHKISSKSFHAVFQRRFVAITMRRSGDYSRSGQTVKTPAVFYGQRKKKGVTCRSSVLALGTREHGLARPTIGWSGSAADLSKLQKCGRLKSRFREGVPLRFAGGR